jgi:signal transduction histidine kinase
VDDLPPVLADRQLVSQLLQNLLSNAIKYRREGVPPQIHIGAARDGDFHRIRITDNGCGLDASESEIVFAPSCRIRGDSEVPGTGLGLATCRKIVRRHGGEIGVTAERDKGATFWFTLPAVPRDTVEMSR